MKRVLMVLTAVGAVVSAFAEFTCSVKVDEGEIGQSRTASVSAQDDDWMDKMVWFNAPYMSACVWSQNQDYAEETGFDESMVWRAVPELLYKHGYDVFLEYGVFSIEERLYCPLTVKFEIDTGKTGVYKYETTDAINGRNAFYFRFPFEAIEGFPTMGGLGYYTLKTTVLCDGYDPVTASQDFQVNALSSEDLGAVASIGVALGDAYFLESVGSIDFPQRDYGTSGNEWFVSLFDPRDISLTRLFAQSGLCGKGQTSVLDMRAFEPMRMTFSTGVTGGKLEFVSGVNENYEQRIMACGNGTHTVLVGTNDAEWVRWVFTRGDSEYKLDEACYAALGDLKFDWLCRVSFDSNGGTSTCPPIWAVQGESYDSVEPFPEDGPAPPEPLKDSCGCIRKTYEFDGWYLGNERVTGASIVPDSSGVTLFARWRENDNPQPKNGEKPNLVVNITVEPTEGTLDDRFKFEVTISNVGDWDAGPFWTRLYLDGEKFSSDMYSKCLAVGRQSVRHRRRRGTALGPGTHVMTAVVDYADGVKESNEGDNSSACMFSIIEIPIPELDVDFEFATPTGRQDSFYLSPNAKGATVCSSFTNGEPVCVFTGVTNAGSSRVEAPFSASFLLKRGDTIVGEDEYTWNGIEQGEVVEIPEDKRMLAILQRLETGSYTLKCTLDPDNEYDETDETDNVRTIAFDIVDEMEKVVVSFAANGGSCSMTRKEVSKGSAIGELPVATHDGYDFLGWFTSATGGERLTAASIVTEDIVLCAHWRERPPDSPLPVVTTIAKPVAVEGLVYTGSKQQGVTFDARLSFVGVVEATSDGSYEATFTLPPDTEIFSWEDGTTAAVTIEWTIAPAQQGPGSTRDVTIALSQGWNWVSLNVTPENATLSAVFAGVAFADEDMVKSADGVATYYGGSWYGDLAALKPGVAYMVKKSTAGSATVAVAGAAAETSVAVTAGWNWIGCTATEEVSLDALVHSDGFADEDTISSAEAVATYYGGKWYGELKALKPGVGYKAKFAKGGTLTFGKGL